MQWKKQKGNNLKNEMAIKILVNYFFMKINIFHWEIQKMTISLKLEIIGPLIGLNLNSINLRNNWHHADHNFNQPAEQLASCGPLLQSAWRTIGIMRSTTSINLRNNWHHAVHNFNQPAEQLVSSLCGFPYPEAKIWTHWFNPYLIHLWQFNDNLTETWYNRTSFNHFS